MPCGIGFSYGVGYSSTTRFVRTRIQQESRAEPFVEAVQMCVATIGIAASTFLAIHTCPLRSVAESQAMGSGHDRLDAGNRRDGRAVGRVRGKTLAQLS
jgi:hypothetical protein